MKKKLLLLIVSFICSKTIPFHLEEIPLLTINPANIEIHVKDIRHELFINQIQRYGIISLAVAALGYNAYKSLSTLHSFRAAPSQDKQTDTELCSWKWTCERAQAIRDQTIEKVISAGLASFATHYLAQQVYYNPDLEWYITTHTSLPILLEKMQQDALRFDELHGLAAFKTSSEYEYFMRELIADMYIIIRQSEGVIGFMQYKRFEFCPNVCVMNICTVLEEHFIERVNELGQMIYTVAQNYIDQKEYTPVMSDAVNEFIALFYEIAQRITNIYNDTSWIE